MTTYEEPVPIVSNPLPEDQTSSFPLTSGSIDDSGDGSSGSEFPHDQQITATRSNKLKNQTTSMLSADMNPKPVVTEQPLEDVEGSLIGIDHEMLLASTNGISNESEISIDVSTFGSIDHSSDEASRSEDFSKPVTNTVAFSDETADTFASVVAYKTTEEKTTIFSPFTNNFNSIPPSESASSVPIDNDFSSTTVFEPSTSDLPRNHSDTKIAMTSSSVIPKASINSTNTDSYYSTITIKEDFTPTSSAMGNNNTMAITTIAPKITTSLPLNSATNIFKTSAEVELSTEDLFDQLMPSGKTESYTFPLETMQSSYKRTKPIDDQKTSTTYSIDNLTQSLQSDEGSTGFFTDNPMTSLSQSAPNTPKEVTTKLTTTSYPDKKQITSNEQATSAESRPMTPMPKSGTISNRVATSGHIETNTLTSNEKASSPSFGAISNRPGNNDGSTFSEASIPTTSRDDVTVSSNDTTLTSSVPLTELSKVGATEKSEWPFIKFETSVQPASLVSSISKRQSTVSLQPIATTTSTTSIQNTSFEPTSVRYQFVSTTENNLIAAPTLLDRITNASLAAATSSYDVDSSSARSVPHTEEMSTSTSMKATKISSSTAPLSGSIAFSTTKHTLTQTPDVMSIESYSTISSQTSAALEPTISENSQIIMTSNTPQTVLEVFSSAPSTINPFHIPTATNSIESNQGHELTTPNQNTSNYMSSSTSGVFTSSKAAPHTTHLTNKPIVLKTTVDAKTSSTFFSKTTSSPRKMDASFSNSVANRTSTLENYSTAMTIPSASTKLFQSNVSVSTLTSSPFMAGSTNKFLKTAATTNFSTKTQALSFSTEEGTILLHSTGGTVNFTTGVSATYSVPLLVFSGIVVLLILVLVLSLPIVVCSNRRKRKARINGARETSRERMDMFTYVGSSWNNFSEEVGASKIFGPKLKLHASNSNSVNSPNKSRVLGKLERLWSSSSRISANTSISTSRNASCTEDTV